MGPIFGPVPLFALLEISSDGLAGKVGTASAAIGGGVGGLLLGLIVAAVAITLFVGKRRTSDRVDGDDSEVDSGTGETMTTFTVNEEYLRQEGFSAEGQRNAVGGEARNIPDES
jgi:hypothetical protein